MKKSELENLQEMREGSTGENRKKIQRMIDDHFFKNPHRRKKKKKKMIIESDDMWFY